MKIFSPRAGERWVLDHVSKYDVLLGDEDINGDGDPRDVDYPPIFNTDPAGWENYLTLVVEFIGRPPVYRSFHIENKNLWEFFVYFEDQHNRNLIEDRWRKEHSRWKSELPDREKVDREKERKEYEDYMHSMGVLLPNDIPQPAPEGRWWWPDLNELLNELEKGR